jgi:hypothetical protein
MQARREFANTIPDMLKYAPKKFWGMLKKKEDSEVTIAAEDFAAFNQKLFFDPHLPKDEFRAPPPSPQLHITPGELAECLQKKFKANKSTGLS